MPPVGFNLSYVSGCAVKSSSKTFTFDMRYCVQYKQDSSFVYISSDGKKVSTQKVSAFDFNFTYKNIDCIDSLSCSITDNSLTVDNDQSDDGMDLMCLTDFSITCPPGLEIAQAILIVQAASKTYFWIILSSVSLCVVVSFGVYSIIIEVIVNKLIFGRFV